MQKRGKILIKNLAVTNIFLIVFSVVAFAFLIGDIDNVSGAIGTLPPGIPEGSKLMAGTTNFYSAPNGAIYEVVGENGVLTSYRLPGATTTGTESGSILSDVYGGNIFGAQTGTFFSALLQGTAWGVTVYVAAKLLTSLLGVDDNLSDAISTSLGVGTFAGFFAANLMKHTIGNTIVENPIFGLGPGTFGPLLAITVAAVVFFLIYKDESKEVVKFQCLPWQAPVGGKDCEKCNSDPFRPCSEYRCRSLGQACEIVNAGTEEEKCVWVNPNDPTPPTITPWEEPLTQGLKYTSHETRPPARGTKIVRNNVANGCLQAFTPLTFGFTTNEPAQCKIDIIHRNDTDSMQYFVGGSNFFRYNHTQTMSLPSPSSINAEAPEFQNDGRYELFVRCRDKNGNGNVDEYAVQFCVDPSPDTTPPVIVDTSIRSGSPVTYGIGQVPLDVYVNEPSTCKWSVQSKAYEEMENTMTCATSLTQINARELYTCSTTLTGVQDRVDNSYYFRCKDQPNKPENERNVNQNSYNFTLKGSQPLNIISVGPNSTITGSTSAVNVELKVITDDGAEEGKALCSFSPTGQVGSFIEMFETNNFEHKQVLTLGSGSYNYRFRCVDLGGNSAQADTNFTVIVDNQPPLITRAYHDAANNAIKIVTNEDAACVYSLNSCNYNFDDGNDFIYIDNIRKKHFAEWQPNIAYYIKCKDDFGNQPAPNSCSLVASATNIG